MKNDHFWEIGVNVLDKEQNWQIVYYRTPADLSPENVPKYAVRDGYLHYSFMEYVKYTLEITPEEYLEYMWE